MLTNYVTLYARPVIIVNGCIYNKLQKNSLLTNYRLFKKGANVCMAFILYL